MSAEHLRWMWARMVVSLAGPRAVVRIPNKGPLWQTAVHEAAHAVAARALGIHVREATTIPKWEGGRMVTRGHVLLGVSPTVALPAACLSDHQVVQVGLICIFPSEHNDWRTLLGHRRRLQAEADRLVEERWAAIEALAFRLLWDQRLGAEEIEAVLGAGE